MKQNYLTCDWIQELKNQVFHDNEVKKFELMFSRILLHYDNMVKGKSVEINDRFIELLGRFCIMIGKSEFLGGPYMFYPDFTPMNVLNVKLIHSLIE